MDERKEISVWDRNKQFFGTASQPDQISRLLDMLKEQDKRIDQLEGIIQEPDEIATGGAPKKRGRPKKNEV